MNELAAVLAIFAARRTTAEPWRTEFLRSIEQSSEATEEQTSARMLPDTGRPLEEWVALLRAAMRPEDVERLRADAETAVKQLTPGSYFRSAARRVLEVAHLLAGNEGFPGGTTAHVTEQSDGVDLETIRFRMRLGARLTAAERRLLPLLATHLTYKEIGERLYITRNTVKSEALSAYHKLGVNSRSVAVERAVELGLIEATAATGADDLGRKPAVTQDQLSQLTAVVVVALGAGRSHPAEMVPV